VLFEFMVASWSGVTPCCKVVQMPRAVPIAPVGSVRLIPGHQCWTRGPIVRFLRGYEYSTQRVAAGTVQDQPPVRNASAVVSTTAFISQHSQRCDLHIYRTADAAYRYKRPR
jgi:hypothetical protein